MRVVTCLFLVAASIHSFASNSAQADGLRKGQRIQALNGTTAEVLNIKLCATTQAALMNPDMDLGGYDEIDNSYDTDVQIAGLPGHEDFGNEAPSLLQGLDQAGLERDVLTNPFGLGSQQLLMIAAGNNSSSINTRRQINCSTKDSLQSGVKAVEVAIAGGGALSAITGQLHVTVVFAIAGFGVGVVDFALHHLPCDKLDKNGNIERPMTEAEIKQMVNQTTCELLVKNGLPCDPGKL